MQICEMQILQEDRVVNHGAIRVAACGIDNRSCAISGRDDHTIHMDQNTVRGLLGMGHNVCEIMQIGLRKPYLVLANGEICHRIMAKITGEEERIFAQTAG